MFLHIILGFTVFLSGSHCIQEEGDMQDLLKIDEGDYAYIDEFPFLVSVDYDSMHICGGVLIRSNWVLTAAHCMHAYYGDDLKELDLRRFSVQAGMTLTQDYPIRHPDTSLLPYPTIDPTKGDANHDPEPSRSAVNSPNRKSVVAKVPTIYPRDTTLNEDLILLMLKGKFKFSKKIQLPERWPDAAFIESLEPGTMCSVAGWGWQADAFMNRAEFRSANGKARRRVRQSAAAAGHASSRSTQEGNVTDDHAANKTHKNSRRAGGFEIVNVYLNSVSMQLEDLSFCKNRTSLKVNVHESMQMCASETGAASCVGDSGGPLVCLGIPVGISSFGVRKCGVHEGFAVFTRMDYFMSWISDMVDSNDALRKELSAATTTGAFARSLVVFCVSAVVFVAGMFS